MKKFRLKKFNVTLAYFLMFMSLEILFRLLKGISIFNLSIIYLTIFNAFLALLLSFLVNLGNVRTNKYSFYIVAFLITFIFGLEFMIHEIFGSYFEWSLFKLTDQAAGFASDGVKFIFKNIFSIIVLFIPFGVLVALKNRVIVNASKKKNVIKLVGACLTYALFLLSLNIGSNTTNSAKDLFYKVNNMELSIKNIGVTNSFFLNGYRSLIGYEEPVVIVDKKLFEEEHEPEVISYSYNNLDIDFDALIASESNDTIKSMHEYFKNESGTLQNEYTGYFKDKNLIMFMAESFNEVAVREDLTPTLYKLVNSGFVFENFYTPTILSTIGGEFQEVTGLVASSKLLAPWRKGVNAFPMGLGKLFKDAGFVTHAYHDHSYAFQDRYKYLNSIGFDNFKACFNGLEKQINCHQWPESDVEMIEATIDDYINTEGKFMTYYVTVSGHGDYGWSSSAMARKNRAAVDGLDYSEKPLSYLAANIELDKALELLIKKLEEAGKLDDTVIALVGDHNPYYLTLNEINEIATYQKDEVIERNHSNFILWNSAMDTVKVTKVGSQIDVLPTIYNIFGLPYDSRLIIGKDILSTEPGLAIFGNASWVSDKGKYFANGNKFIPSVEDVPEDYVKYMNSIVSNKIIMSRNIIMNDYYGKVFGE